VFIGRTEVEAETLVLWPSNAKSLLIKVKEESERDSLTLKKLRSWYLVPSLHDKQKEEKWKQWQILFSWAPESLWTMTTAMKLNDAWS